MLSASRECLAMAACFHEVSASSAGLHRVGQRQQMSATCASQLPRARHRRAAPCDTIRVPVRVVRERSPLCGPKSARKKEFPPTSTLNPCESFLPQFRHYPQKPTKTHILAFASIASMSLAAVAADERVKRGGRRKHISASSDRIRRRSQRDFLKWLDPVM